MIKTQDENIITQTTKRPILIYAGVTVFCLVFCLIYYQFSHGVHSPFMSFMFAWPLLLGLVPSLIMALWGQTGRRGKWSQNFYHSGVAALTVSSMLRGIFDIAGTASDYQWYLMVAGFIFLILGIVLYVRGK